MNNRRKRDSAIISCYFVDIDFWLSSPQSYHKSRNTLSNVLKISLDTIPPVSGYYTYCDY